MIYKSAGRCGAVWRRTQATVLSRSDICCFCGHPGADAVNHDDGWLLAPQSRNDPDRCSPIHGVAGCPYCKPRWSKKLRRLVPPACNSLVGARPLAVALAQRAGFSRDW